MDYSYELFFERDALVDVLEALATLAEPTGEPTTLVLPDRTLTLPYSTWADTPAELRWDDPAPSWQFATSLLFEPDEPILDYLQPQFPAGPEADAAPRHDARGRVAIGYIYLAVGRDLTDQQTGADDLVLFSFGTPGSKMSVLFFESASIRRTFSELLAGHRGVYGLLDLEDPADLFWWRGREVDVSLPTAEMTLPQIEELVEDEIGDVRRTTASADAAAGPLPTGPDGRPALTFQADEVCATARHLRRTTTGSGLGVHHWLLAVLETDPGLGSGLPARLGVADAAAAVAELRRRLALGQTGEPLPEEELLARAGDRAAGRGADRVSARDLAALLGEAAL